MKSFDCLSQKTNIFGKHFLEASAGCGKTFAIEHLFLRLLIESFQDQKPLEVDSLLIVTFTRVAAKELKLRIRSNIEKALELLKTSKKVSDIYDLYDYLKPHFEKKEEIIRLLQDALDMYEESQIFTIHGFCYYILKEFAFDTESLFEITEDFFYKKLAKTVIFDYLRYFIDLKIFSHEQISIFFKKYNDFHALVDKLINFSKSTIESQKYPYFSEILEKFNKHLSSLEIFPKEIIDNFYSIEPSFKKIIKTSSLDLIKQIEILLKVAKKKKCEREEFDEILKTKFSIFKFLDSSNIKKRAVFPKIDSFFDFAKKNLYPLILEASDSNKIFFNLALEISKKIKEKMKEEEVISPDDILKKMDKALEKEEFREKAQERYKAVIIDEFQDTDPLQWSIFEKIFLKDKKDLVSMYLVGDPKQSIYSFRNADIYTYLKALKTIGKSNVSFLDTNFRSYPNLVTSLNAIFSNEFASNWLKLPKLNEHLPYIPVLSGVKKEDKEKRVHFFIGREKFSHKKWPSLKLEENFFYPYIAKEIFKLNSKKVRYEDIAILVKDRYQAKSLSDFLNKKGIFSVSKTHTLISNLFAAKALKEIFLAVIFFKDINKIKIALMTPYIGYTDLKEEAFQEESLQESLIQFSYLNNIFKKKGLSQFFKEFLNSKWKNKKTVFENIIDKEDLSFYSNTMQLIELLIELDEEKKFSSFEILNFFEKMKDLSDDPRLTVKSEIEENAVQIMTIHMSKGLEFDVVFALGIVNRTNIEAKQDISELNAEKLRQLYVSMTRARKKLYVPIAIDIKHKKPKVETISAMELFLMKEGEILEEEEILKKLKKLEEKAFVSFEILKEEEFDFIKKQENEKLNFEFEKPFPIIKKEKQIHSFSSLSKSIKHKIIEAKTKEGNILFSSENLTPGIEIGILLHKIFENLLSGKYLKFYETEIIEKVVFEEMIGMKMSKELIIKMVKKALFTPLFKNGFAIKDIKLSNMYVEEEFLFSQEEESLIKGFIDLIFYHEGKYYILDWKTNWLGDNIKCYEKEKIKHAMEENNYFFQAAIYTKALKRFLKIIDKREFEKIFGGVLYIFLRGLSKDYNGIYKFFPNVEDLLCLKT